jgi:hypothetical protein
LWDRGDVVSERGIVDLVNQDPEERMGFVVGIRLELRVNLDYERAGYCRE